MAARDDINTDITPQVLLKAYSCGIFPMAESADDPALYWIEPQHRGILPLDSVHVPKRLARTVRTAEFTVKVDNDFELVISGCAEPRPGRRSTWINSRIHRLYRDLFDMGRCHTVEVWAGDEIAGGLYGVSLGRIYNSARAVGYGRWALELALESWDTRVPTGKFNAFLAELAAAHPHPVRGGRQPRILFGTQATTRPPTFVVFTTQFLDPQYRRFITRRLREVWGFEGSPIEIQMRVRERRGPKR